MKDAPITKIFSVVLTLTVIFVLVISGPAAAVLLDVVMPSDSMSEQDPVSFQVRIDIAAGEHVPVQNLTLNIANEDNSELYSCVFDIKGNPLSACDNFSVEKVLGSGSYGSGFGYGYGAGGYQNTPFGYGYGFGYVGSGPELIYNITWQPPQVSSDEIYSIRFYATASDGNNTFIYATMAASQFTLMDTLVEFNDENLTVSNNETVIEVDPTFVAGNVTVPSGIENVSLDFEQLANITAGQKTVELPAPITVKAETSGGAIRLFLVETNLTGSAGWDGRFMLPVTVPSPVRASDIASSGYTATIRSSIEIGSDDVLESDKAIRIVFEGQARRLVGLYSGGSFNKIRATCSADTQAANDLLAAGASCKINVGSDLVVWTKHFSTFITYTETEEASSSSSSSSGGGGGGGGALPSCTSDWSCTEWSACSESGVRTRTCTDANSCAGATKPATEEQCTYEPAESDSAKDETGAGNESQAGEEGTDEAGKKEPATGDATAEGDQAPEEKIISESGKGGFWWTLLIIVVIAGVIAGYFMSNSVTYLHKRSERLHKLADEHHSKGNVSKAQRLHEKAYKLQQKALDKKLR